MRITTWTSQEEDILVQLWKETDDLKAISEKLGRQIGGVRSRLIKLGHLEKNSYLIRNSINCYIFNMYFHIHYLNENDHGELYHYLS